MNRWDVEGTVSEIEEGQFTMGSGDSGGETRLQHPGNLQHIFQPPSIYIYRERE